MFRLLFPWRVISNELLMIKIRFDDYMILIFKQTFRDCDGKGRKMPRVITFALVYLCLHIGYFRVEI